jgi:hypothetical protein
MPFSSVLIARLRELESMHVHEHSQALLEVVKEGAPRRDRRAHAAHRRRPPRA